MYICTCVGNLKIRKNAIVKFPDYQIPVTQLKMLTRNFVIFLAYRCK